MKALITGANGQLGWELQQTAPARWRIVALDRGAFDITYADAVQQVVRSEQPHLIINAAAYTAVDKAEEEEAKAYAVNADGAANIATAARDHGVRLIHISTDFVFDGHKSQPYLPEDPVNPLGVYGASKLKGEQNVTIISGGNALIVRTSWVYSIHGNNFVTTMLRLMAERPKLRVVADQVGSPTWAKGLAHALWAAAEKIEVTGMLHWSDAGVASWYDFAVAIMEEALAIGLLQKELVVEPITTSGYPTAAQRPHYSVLDKEKTWETIGYKARHWREGLRSMLLEYKGLHNA
jgi:dTDP-4-dehydrorhamnose reductase